MSTKPPCLRSDALAVLARLRQAGHIAYFAGGCVRDELLGLVPKDFDVATDAAPQRVRELFPRTQAVGQAFGVILVRQGESVVEVATFRSDADYADGRRPGRVVFATPEQDAQRRDFTINGLFLDPLADNRVIDFVGGLADLKAGVLRAIGDPAARFAEDHLRLLRAVRFAARFGLAVESTTEAALRRDAPLLKRISPERIAEELRLALTPTPTRSIAWQMLWDYRLAETIFRTPTFPRPPVITSGAAESGGTGILPVSSALAHGLEARATLCGLFAATAADSAISFGLALSAGTLDLLAAAADDLRSSLARGRVQKLVNALRQSLKISNEESDEIQETLETLGHLLADVPPTLAALKRFRAKPTAAGTVALLEALRAIGRYSVLVEAIQPRLAELEGVDCAPAPLITGDDLTAAGMPPGPRFKKILDAVYDAQLEGRLPGKSAAVDMALGLK